MGQAIKIAIENGWVDSIDWFERTIFPELREKRMQVVMRMYHRYVLLDPLFWQALGKGLGWEDKRGIEYTPGGHPVNVYYGGGWQDKWHRFVDHLVEGKDIESFFNELIK